MSKLNSPHKLKRARNVKLTGAGVQSGSTHHLCDQSALHTEYVKGHHAFRNGECLNNRWHPHRREGWKAARNEEILFYQKTGSKGSLERLAAVGFTLLAA